MSDLSQKELKRLFYYDSETGDFFRRVRTSSNANVGDIAGSYSNGYRWIRINGKLYLAHRLAFFYMDGKFPGKGVEIDHINHDRGDNTWLNLRIVTHQENGKNCSMSRKNKSGFVGVSWYKEGKKWRADITVDGKSKFLGLFEDKNDAIAARMVANEQFGFFKNHGKRKEDIT